MASSLLVPKAKDGSIFSPKLKSAGGFTVGRKGDERKMADYEQALAYLRAQPSAYWRRPNEKGNWGIVTGVCWVDINET
mgnify:CR=1 FL=1